MTIIEAWKIFTQTGKISDYLKYIEIKMKNNKI